MRIGLVGLGRIGSFHAEVLLGLDEVDHLVLADARPGLARATADRLSVVAPDRVTAVPPEELTSSGVDALVVATATAGHEGWIRAGVAAGLPTFCEKPAAADLAGTIDLAALEADTDVPVQIGFQRRFDTGYLTAREAVRSGLLGFVHTVRLNSHDQSPPPVEFIATSGGIFRDCGVHDFDILRFVTGREVTSVFATGANKGAAYFTAAGDVDTGAALLTLDDGTLAVFSTTRYNGAGHDVRMEVMGEHGTIAVGLDHSLAMDSAEPDVDFPRGPRMWSFMERFAPAFRAELAGFLEVAAGSRRPPATVADALLAFRTAEACELSRAEGRPVDLSEIKGARS